MENRKKELPLTFDDLTKICDAFLIASNNYESRFMSHFKANARAQEAQAVSYIVAVLKETISTSKFSPHPETEPKNILFVSTILERLMDLTLARLKNVKDPGGNFADRINKIRNKHNDFFNNKSAMNYTKLDEEINKQFSLPVEKTLSEEQIYTIKSTLSNNLRAKYEEDVENKNKMTSQPR